MEFDESKYKPKSNRSVLYEQVLEQSDICDVTIQVGEWRKKFHWCVLVISPFFESLRRNNFIEKQTGVVKLNIASPLTTETAILYLYGKKPKLTEDNISAMLELSEFLAIPSLKSSCVRYIKTMSITSENCMQMLELSSLYDFELTKCYEYIRGHLDDLLQKKEATHLSKESVMELLTDPLLSYVTPEDRFSYLVKWSEKCPRNGAAFAEVFATIDLDEMDKEFLEKEVLQHPLVENKCDAASLQAQCSPEEHKVLIFSNSIQQKRLACFDLAKEKWCGIETSLPDGSELSRMYFSDVIRGVRGPQLPEIYKVDNTYASCRVCNFNLQSKQISMIKVTADENEGRFSCFSLQDETFVAVKNKTNWINRKVKTVESEPIYGLARKKRASRQGQCGVSSRFVSFESQKKVMVRNSNLYYGHLQSPTTNIHPMVTILDIEISSCCVNLGNLVALLSDQQKTLFIYDMASCQIDNVQLEQNVDLEDRYHNRNMQLIPSDNGFILHNKEQAVVISRLYGPALTEKYVVKRVTLENDEHWDNVQYFYCDKTWFRFLHRSWKDKIEFASVSHEHLVDGNGQDLPWRQLPVIEELSGVFGGDRSFLISLHRSLLKCHFKCPHCEVLKSKRTRAYSSTTLGDSDDLYDDSDDDYTGYQYPVRASVYDDMTSDDDYYYYYNSD